MIKKQTFSWDERPLYRRLIISRYRVNQANLCVSKEAALLHNDDMRDIGLLTSVARVEASIGEVTFVYLINDRLDNSKDAVL
jgi:hypothetical protein